MLQLNYRDPRPIYEQVKSEFRRLILSGALPRGEKLPSVRELAGSLAINPNTIQRAYRELETEGCIISMPGKGSFVAVSGLGESAAWDIMDGREGKTFLSIEEFSMACPKVSKSHIEDLKAAGAFGDLPENNQMTLF